MTLVSMFTNNSTNDDKKKLALSEFETKENKIVEDPDIEVKLEEKQIALKKELSYTEKSSNDNIEDKLRKHDDQIENLQSDDKLSKIDSNKKPNLTIPSVKPKDVIDENKEIDIAPAKEAPDSILSKRLKSKKGKISKVFSININKSKNNKSIAASIPENLSIFNNEKKPKEKLRRINNSEDQVFSQDLSIHDTLSLSNAKATKKVNKRLAKKLSISSKGKTIHDDGIEEKASDTKTSKKSKVTVNNDQNILERLNIPYDFQKSHSESNKDKKEIKMCKKAIWFQSIRERPVNYSRLQKILSSDKKMVNSIISSCSRKTALHLSMPEVQLRPVSLRLNSPFEISLHYENESLELVTFLIKNNADVNSLDNSMSTPLHQAARMNYSKITKLLLESGADPFAKNIFGFVPTDMTRNVNLYNIINDFATSNNISNSTTKKTIDENYLIEFVRKYKAKGISKRQILTMFGTTFIPNIASENRLYTLMEILINEIGYDVNETDEYFTPPIHAALRQYDTTMLLILLRNKANPMLVDYFGNSISKIMMPEKLKMLRIYVKKYEKSTLKKALFTSNKVELFISNSMLLAFIEKYSDLE